MKILIIGGNSALALSLINSLNLKHSVITAGRKNCDITIDLNNEIKIDKFPKNIDTVIHIAASFGGTTYTEFEDAININVLGTLKVCQLSQALNAKQFILISSIFSCLTIKSPYYTSYALTKRQSEEIASLYFKNSNTNLTILRPSQIYGNSIVFSKHQPFFYHILNKAKNGEDVLIYGKNDALRNYIYVDDLNQIISHTINKKISGVFYCGSMEDVTYSAIAKIAFKEYSKDGQVRFLNDKKNIPDNIFEKDNTLYEKINFYPETTIERGIKLIIMQGDL